MEVTEAAYRKAVQGKYSAPRRVVTKEVRTALPDQQEESFDKMSLSNTAKEKLRSQEEGNLFTSGDELNQYLKQNFPAYQSGMVSVPKRHLRDCFSDPEKLAALEENLEAIPDILEETKSNLLQNTRLLSCTFSIDEAEEKLHRLKEIATDPNDAAATAGDISIKTALFLRP